MESASILKGPRELLIFILENDRGSNLIGESLGLTTGCGWQLRLNHCLSLLDVSKGNSHGPRAPGIFGRSQQTPQHSDPDGLGYGPQKPGLEFALAPRERPDS